MKVYVNEKGEITSNGSNISLENLDKQLKDQNGEVFYSRANVANDPPEESMMVIQLFMNYELPINLSSTHEFLCEI